MLPRVKSSLGQAMKGSLRNIGLELTYAKNTLDQVRSAWLERLDIGLVVDGGANLGQYAEKLFAQGFQGAIVSIEPLPDVFPKLHRRTTGNPWWTCLPFALGSRDGTAEMHIASNRVSSSILPTSTAHDEVAPAGRQIGSVEVPVRRLDTIWGDGGALWSTPFMLKLDLQGYEVEALKGSQGVLADCRLIECELSLDQLYDGQPLLEDVMAYLSDEGYRPVWLERGLTDHKHRRILQMDALFARLGA